MSIKKISALCLTFAAIGGAAASPANAASGSIDVGGIALPPGCDAEVWWNSTGNPIAGATIGNPTYCVKRILAPIVITTVDLPPLPPISAS